MAMLCLRLRLIYSISWTGELVLSTEHVPLAVRYFPHDLGYCIAFVDDCRCLTAHLICVLPLYNVLDFIEQRNDK